MKPSCVSVVAISDGHLIQPLPSVNTVNSDPLAKVGTMTRRECAVMSGYHTPGKMLLSTLLT